jgi:hypothetical protein
VNGTDSELTTLRVQCPARTSAHRRRELGNERPGSEEQATLLADPAEMSRLGVTHRGERSVL